MSETKKKRYFPSSFLIIISIMLIFIVASWIGQAVTNDINGVGLLDVFSAIWRGFANKADVILFIFSIGGTLGVMTKIKAIDAGIDALVNKLGNKIWLLIPSLMIIFGLGGSTYGMWEETIAFIPVLIPVFKKANYGSFTAILVILIGAGIGCLASTVNPFSIGVAVKAVNGVAGKTVITSGALQGTRWLSFFIFEVIGISMVTWIATRYKKAFVLKIKTEQEAINATSKSNIFVRFFTRARVPEGINKDIIDKRFREVENIEFTKKRKISLGLFITAFILMIIMYLPWGNWISDLDGAKSSYNKSMFWFASTGSLSYEVIGDWGFVSVAALFLIVSVIIFSINFKSFKSEEDNAEQGFINSYMDGVKDVVSVCLLIATAGGLGIILKSTGFGQLIAKQAASGLNTWMAFGIVIFIISIVLSCLIPSSSGFAGAFMPIFGQIAIVAFPNNTETAIALAIMGFLFGNGIANLFSPTSAALMAYTSYAGVPYNVWIKQTWKITVVVATVSLLLIIAFSAAASSGGLF